MSKALFVVATAYRTIYTVAGGYITARLAPNKPMGHVWTLGVIGLLAAIAGTAATWDKGPEFGPKWYPVALVVLAIGVLLALGLAAVVIAGLAAHSLALISDAPHMLTDAASIAAITSSGVLALLMSALFTRTVCASTNAASPVTRSTPSSRAPGGSRGRCMAFRCC